MSRHQKKDQPTAATGKHQSNHFEGVQLLCNHNCRQMTMTRRLQQSRNPSSRQIGKFKTRKTFKKSFSDKIAKLAGRIILAENAFQALGDNDSLRTLFTQSPFLESWINPHDTRKDQANALRTRIDESRKEKAQLQDRENALHETHLLLLQARLDKVTQQTRNDESNVPTEVTGLESGLFNVESIFRIGWSKDTKIDIGLLKRVKGLWDLLDLKMELILNLGKHGNARQNGGEKWMART